MATQSAKYLARHQREIVKRMLRVNHAGELGADRIYYGQMCALRSNRGDPAEREVQRMWNEEKHHLATFERLLVSKQGEKSLLSPLWNVGGFAIGFVGAMLGPKVAMATTVAIEKVITEHYNDQIRTLVSNPQLAKDNQDLIEIISRFRDDEQHHHDTGLANDAEQAPLYKLIYHGMQLISKASIAVAQRI
jgi:ubiquinone biosynthesis monooxygenase Coq7